jgi:uncharacterized protein (TIGR03067 family)
MRTFALTVAVLAVASLARAEDDPEPPGSGLRRLRGTWKMVRVLVKGKERTSDATYTFEKDRAIYTFGDKDSKGGTYTMTLKADKDRPNVIEMRRQGGPPMRYFFKIENGELYLVQIRSSDPKVKPDYSGKGAPVRVLKREMK